MCIQQVLRVHARQTTCSSDVDYARIADLTTGFSPAELAAIVNEVHALHRNWLQHTATCCNTTQRTATHC